MTFQKNLCCFCCSSSGENFCLSAITIFMIILVLGIIVRIRTICSEVDSFARFYNIIRLIFGVLALVYSRDAYKSLLLKKWSEVKVYSTFMLVYMAISFICKMVFYFMGLGFLLNVKIVNKRDPEELSQYLIGNFVIEMFISMSLSAYLVNLAYSLKTAVYYLIVQKDVDESNRVVIVVGKKDEVGGNETGNEQSEGDRGEEKAVDQVAELPNISFESNEESRGLKNFV